MNILLANTRSLAPEIDEVRSVMLDVKPWLRETISDSQVNIPGYSFIARNRRVDIHGGVGLYIHDSIKFEPLDEFSDPDFESLWVWLRPRRLPRGFPFLVAGTVYHPQLGVNNSGMLNHLTTTLTDIVGQYPGCGIFVCGDFIRLSLRRLTSQFKLKQIIDKPTRGGKILDLVLTNLSRTYDENAVYTLPPFGLSDHNVVIVRTKKGPSRAGPNRKLISRRDSRAELGRFFSAVDWSILDSAPNNSDRSRVTFTMRTLPLLYVKWLLFLHVFMWNYNISTTQGLNAVTENTTNTSAPTGSTATSSPTNAADTALYTRPINATNAAYTTSPTKVRYVFLFQAVVPYGYVEIANSDGDTFGTYCGEETGTTVHVTGAFAVITFSSVFSVQERGFSLLFSFIVRYVFLFQAVVPYDYVKIANSDGDTFGTYCGEETGTTVHVTGAFAVITFSSDFIVEERGFSLLFSFIGCGSMRNNLLKSPGYPNNYPRNMYCVYHVNITHGMALRIYFDDFHLKNDLLCWSDYVKISNSNGDKFGRYCGKKTGKTVYVWGAFAEITFRSSDYSMQERGFSLLFSFIGCGSARNNSLKSPGYPKNYPQKMYCVYHVNITHGMALRIYFDYFHLERDPLCGYDYVEIANSDGDTFGTYCGTKTGKTVHVTGAFAVITFSSDYFVQKRGFSLLFSFIESDRCVEGYPLDKITDPVTITCQLRNVATSQYLRTTPSRPLSAASTNTGCGSVNDNLLKSPRYPNEYPENMHCIYRVDIPHGMALRIYFYDFQIKYKDFCRDDYVEISNADDIIFGKYCGKKNGTTVHVTGDYALITFHSNPELGARGFYLQFSTTLQCVTGPANTAVTTSTTVSPSLQPPGVPQGSCLGPVLFTIYTRKLFQIVERHPPQVHCYADDTQLYVSFSPNRSVDADFAIKSMTDCINDIRSWTISDNLMLNDNKTEFLIIGCGTVSNNSLKSPGYPNNYPGNMSCVYRVNIPHGMAIRIYFDDFRLEYESLCWSDYMKIANSIGDTFGIYCGEKNGTTVQVTGAFAVITFSSDHIVQERGFSLFFSFTCATDSAISGPSSLSATSGAAGSSMSPYNTAPYLGLIRYFTPTSGPRKSPATSGPTNTSATLVATDASASLGLANTSATSVATDASASSGPTNTSAYSVATDASATLDPSNTSAILGATTYSLSASSGPANASATSVATDASTSSVPTNTSAYSVSTDASPTSGPTVTSATSVATAISGPTDTSAISGATNASAADVSATSGAKSTLATLGNMNVSAITVTATTGPTDTSDKSNDDNGNNNNDDEDDDNDNDDDGDDRCW
ncbi:Dorsal-ventral patterning tolloid-like protein 1 [Stylophora pistillata]|uniref:Dorsal-ventral patterning tolloid-like protein 1 n=1 Tax=Stylophora pistillata TaxID=50429 RepID=A0A2B4SIF9_STYPI|nr:Dorsal-ventral patterning tolloid-like protein 1 [Stylophora pistillata]